MLNGIFGALSPSGGGQQAPKHAQMLPHTGLPGLRTLKIEVPAEGAYPGGTVVVMKTTAEAFKQQWRTLALQQLPGAGDLRLVDSEAGAVIDGASLADMSGDELLDAFTNAYAPASRQLTVKGLVNWEAVPKVRAKLEAGAADQEATGGKGHAKLPQEFLADMHREVEIWYPQAEGLYLEPGDDMWQAKYQFVATSMVQHLAGQHKLQPREVEQAMKQ